MIPHEKRTRFHPKTSSRLDVAFARPGGSTFRRRERASLQRPPNVVVCLYANSVAATRWVEFADGSPPVGADDDTFTTCSSVASARVKQNPKAVPATLHTRSVRSASSRTTNGTFPPSLMQTRLTCFPASSSMCSATRVEPVNEMTRGIGCRFRFPAPIRRC
jgi:hypothetical protein